MPEVVPYRVRLTGGTADKHQFQGYDGYMALAGFARTLSLVANYAETGKIRQRGDFDGRHSVMAAALSEGSIVANFFVKIKNKPDDVFGALSDGVARGPFYNALTRRVINRNLGKETNIQEISSLLKDPNKAGDIEALIAIAEPSIKQAHSVIGAGADKMLISGGININPIATFDENTKDYVKQSIDEEEIMTRNFSVSAFNANSGYGGVFDFTLRHTLPFTMNRDCLKRLRQVFSWGLDQYTNRTGGVITATFTRVLALDGRPKRYVILDAARAVTQN